MEYHNFEMCEMLQYPKSMGSEKIEKEKDKKWSNEHN